MEHTPFTSTLFALFDRQRFEGSPQLAALIRETDSRWCSALPDDALELVSAAGEPQAVRPRQQDEEMPL